MYIFFLSFFLSGNSIYIYIYLQIVSSEKHTNDRIYLNASFQKKKKIYTFKKYRFEDFQKKIYFFKNDRYL